MQDVAFDAAEVLWSVKKIVSAIERTSFLLEVLVLAVTALVIALTVFLALKIFRTLSGAVSAATGGISFGSIKQKILNFIFRRR